MFTKIDDRIFLFGYKKKDLPLYVCDMNIFVSTFALNEKRIAFGFVFTYEIFFDKRHDADHYLRYRGVMIFDR